MQVKFHKSTSIELKKQFIDKYKLKEKATLDGSIYVKAKQGIYGLSQSDYWQTNSLKTN